MPRKNAGHTGKPSRNPAGRGSTVKGQKKIVTFYLTVKARAIVKALAKKRGWSQNLTVETLIRDAAERWRE